MLMLIDKQSITISHTANASFLFLFLFLCLFVIIAMVKLFYLKEHLSSQAAERRMMNHLSGKCELVIEIFTAIIRKVRH